MADADAFVIDASVALSWCFEDESSPLTDAILERLTHQTGLAPAIWPLEVANGLRAAERRGRIDEQAVLTATHLLLTLPIRVDEAIGLEAALARVVPLARSFALSAYDATYLDLAVRRGLAIATADDQLARAARAAGIELVEAS